MRHLSIILFLVLIACETTTLSQSLCGNKRADLRGFKGDSTLSLGGIKMSASVIRESRGEYLVNISSGETIERLNIRVCRLHGNVIGEILSKSEETGEISFLLMDVIKSRKKIKFKSAILVQEKLDSSGVTYEFGSSDSLGFDIGFMSVDNVNVGAKKILKARGIVDGRTPFALNFIK